MKIRGMDRKKFVRFYTDWFSPMRYNLMVKDNINTLLSLFKNITSELRIKQSVPLMQMGAYYSALGCYTCINDPLLGWKTIKKSILYRYWEHRIGYRYWQNPERQKKGGYGVNTDIPCLVALSKVIMPFEGEWFAKHFASSVKDGSLYWGNNGNEFPHFVLWLLNKQIVFFNKFSDSKLCHPYDKIAQSWNNSNDLADAIYNICDHHLTSNYPGFDNERVDFDDHLAIINPVEIHLLEHIRKRLGLNTPQVYHELLQEPFYPIPDFVYEISTEEIISEDKFLQQVIDLNKDWCDENV
jgi:hypothetical protein